MKLPDEFYILETAHASSSPHSSEYHSYSILPDDGSGDPRMNYQAEREHYTKVRLLKCTVTEVVRDSTR